jgi:hypothetical protein
MAETAEEEEEEEDNDDDDDDETTVLASSRAMSQQSTASTPSSRSTPTFPHISSSTSNDCRTEGCVAAASKSVDQSSP